MPNKKKLILYFGLAGIIPVLFFSVKELVSGVDEFDFDFITGRLLNLLVAYFLTATISAAVMFGPITFLEKQLPWQGNVWKRLGAELVLTELVAMSVMLLLYFPLQELDIMSHKLQAESIKVEVFINIVISAFMNLFLVAIYEGIVLFNNWKHSLIQNEQLAKENMATKFEALKNQINPHFLFNGLNTLSNLVHEDADKAENFIDEFSYVYRYVLDNQERMVVPLKDEIEFVKSYLKLCKIRFGDSLHVEIKVNADVLDQFIPTLSLQTLVENAIKHNRITKSEPLTIRIVNDNHHLTVENNYQPRCEEVSSPGVGIANLKKRYQILSNASPEFFVSESSYIAKIPLIEPS